MIGRDLLKKFDHTIEDRLGKGKGIAKKKVKLTQWATFTCYLKGEDYNGVPTLAKITKGGWVVEELEAGALLGQDFLKPYGGIINLETAEIDLTQIKLKVKGKIQPTSRACTRKVTTTKKVTLMPGQEAYVPVDYKPLPNDRCFRFEPGHAAGLEAVVDAKTP
ncbi:hypothetical protein QBC35DRAFT_238779, partial [Podospora australis]